LKAQYSLLDEEYLKNKTEEAWKAAGEKIDKEIEEKEGDAEKDIGKKEELKKEAIAAINDGYAFAAWKAIKLSNVKDQIEQEV